MRVPCKVKFLNPEFFYLISFLCVNFWVNAFFVLKHLYVFVSLQQMFDYSRFPKLKDPSGVWNSFITEEGSLDRPQGAVHYLCQGVGKKGG